MYYPINTEHSVQVFDCHMKVHLQNLCPISPPPQRTVRDPRAAQVHQALAWQTAGDVAGGALPRGGEAARPTVR